MPVIPTVTGGFVPSLDRSLGRVSTSVPAGAFGGAKFGQLSRAIGSVSRTAELILAEQERLKDQEDRVIVSNAVSQDRRILRDKRYGEEGYLNLKGSNAIGLSKKFGEEADRLKFETSGKLTPRQAALYERQMNNYIDSDLFAASKYEAEQQNFAAQKALNSEIELDSMDTQQLYDRPLEFEASLETVLEKKRVLMASQGLPEETREAQTRVYESNMTASAIMRLGKEAPTLAEAWLNQSKDKLVQKDKDTLNLFFEKLRTASKAEIESIFIQRDIDRMVDGQGLSQSDALATVREKYVGSLRDEAVRRVKARYNEIQDIEIETQQNLLRDGKLGIDNAVTYEDKSRVIAEMEPELSIDTKKKLQKYINQSSGVVEVKSDNSAKYVEALNRIHKTANGTATTSEIIRSKEELVAEFSPFLTPSTLKGLVKTYDDSGKLNGADESLIEESFLNFTKKPPQALNKQAATREQYMGYREFIRKSLQPNDILSSEKIREIGSRFFVETEGGLFGLGSTTLGEALKEGKTAEFLPDLDQDPKLKDAALIALTAANRRLRAQGRPEIPATTRNLQIALKRSWGLAHEE